MPFNRHLIKSHGNLYATKNYYTKFLAVAVLLAYTSFNLLIGQCGITPVVDPSALPDCATPGEVFSTTLAYDYTGELPASIDTIIVSDASSPGFEIISYGPTEIQEGRNEIDISVVYNGICNPTNLFVGDIVGGGGASDCTQTIAAPIPCCDVQTEFCDFELLTDLSKLPRCATPGETFTTVIEYNYDGEVPASIDTIIVLDESAPGFEILSYGPSEIVQGRNEIEVSVVYDGDCNESNIFVCDVRGAGGAGDCSTIVSSTISCCDSPCETVGGVLSGGPFEFCVGDGEPDYVTGVEVSGNVGTNSWWVVTDPETRILALTPNARDVNFDVAPPGECFLWYVSYEDINGLEVGEFATDLTGCFSFSKGIAVNRIDCEAEPCMINPQIEQSDVPSCVTPGETTTVILTYEYEGELPASLDTIVVWDPTLTGFSIIDFSPTVINRGTNQLAINLSHNGDCDLNESFVIDLVGAEAAFGCNPAVDLTIPCCVDEACVITPITEGSELPTCATPGEVFTTTLVYDYQGSLPANIDTIIVTDASAPGFEIISYSPTEIQLGRNEIVVSVVYNGDCDENNLFVCDVIGGGGAADCTTTVTSPIPCCDSGEMCVFTPLTDISSLPTCAVPGEVFTTTLAYDYQGSLPASIDTIIVTDASADGFQILSYSPTEIMRGTNELVVSVVYDGDCNESNLFVCDVVGAGGAADCSTTVSSPIPCCDMEQEECVITPITDISTLPTCTVPGEVFTTTLAYNYQGALPASIDTIIVTDESADGFEILSYSPTEIQRGQNEIEVSVVYNGDCNESNLFVCDVIGAGGAADCSTTVRSPIPCCDVEEQECIITPITDISSLPTCAVPGEVFTTTLAYDYQGELPASIDTIIVTDESADGFEILSYSPTEIQQGQNEMVVSVVYNGDCNESDIFVCDVIGAGGAADCSTTVRSAIPCCDIDDDMDDDMDDEMDDDMDDEMDDECGNDDQDEDGINDICDNCPTVANADQADENDNGIGDACEEACDITPIVEGLEIPDCLVPGEVFSTTLQYEYDGSLPASIDTVIIREDSSPGFEIISYDPRDIQLGVNDMDVSIVYNGDCNESNLFICDIIGGGGAKACTFTISSSIRCCESNLIDIETYPNPTAGVLFVKAEERSNYDVELFDYTGKKVMISHKEDSNFFIIPTEDIENGTYIMKVTDMESGKVGTEKIAIFR